MSAQNMPALRMNPWAPDRDPRQARRIGKTLEEVNELGAVLARISIQGIDAIDPASGKTNRQRLHEETADVLAQIECNVRAFDMDKNAMFDRQEIKVEQMLDWERHFDEVAISPAAEATPFIPARKEMAKHSVSVEWRFAIPPANTRRVVVQQRQDGPFRGDQVGASGYYYTGIEEYSGQWKHVAGSSTGGHSSFSAAMSAAEDQWRVASAKGIGSAQ